MKNILGCVFIFLVFVLLNSTASGQEGMGGRSGRGNSRAMMEKNRTLVNNMYAWMNSKTLDSLQTIMSKDLVDHNPDQGQKPGLAGTIEMLKGYYVAFPDMKLTADDIVIEGNKIVVRATITGTHQGPMMGMPATGKKFSVTMLEEFIVKDGLITDRYGVFDAAGMLTQLGLMPMPADSTKK